MLEHIQHDDGVRGLAGGVNSLDGALGEINAEPAPALRHRLAGRLHPPCPPSPGAGDFQEQTDVRSRLEQAPAVERVGADPVEHPSEQLSPGVGLVHVRHVLRRRVHVDQLVARESRARTDHPALWAAQNIVMLRQPVAGAGELGHVGRCCRVGLQQALHPGAVAQHTFLGHPFAATGQRRPRRPRAAEPCTHAFRLEAT
jgi:hypothetical protein